jgi:hypothetical protein
LLFYENGKSRPTLGSTSALLLAISGRFEKPPFVMEPVAVMAAYRAEFGSGEQVQIPVHHEHHLGARQFQADGEALDHPMSRS